MQRLRKLIGFMKGVGDLAIRLETPSPGEGKICTDCTDGNSSLVLETYSDADWSSNKTHRRSTSCGVHFLGGNCVYGSSRSQKTISLSSCESELHAMVSECAMESSYWHVQNMCSSRRYSMCSTPIAVQHGNLQADKDVEK